MALLDDWYKAAAAALAAVNPPLQLWAFGDAPADPGKPYATYQAIGPGGRRYVFEAAADWAVVQINVSALKSDPAGRATIAAAFAALDNVPKTSRRGPPLPLTATGDAYRTQRADYEVTQ